MMWHICHLYIFFNEVSVKVLGLLFNQVICFVFLLLSFKSSLYNLNNSTLSGVSLVNILFQCVVCFFIFLIFFLMAKFLLLIKSNYLNHGLRFSCCMQKLIVTLKVTRFSPVLSFRRFIFLHFILRSMVHFECTFVRNVRSVSIFIYLFIACGCSVVSASFVRNTVLAPYYYPCSFVKIRRLYLQGPISKLCSLFY